VLSHACDALWLLDVLHFSLEPAAGRVEAFTCHAGKSLAFLWDTEAPSPILRATPTGRKTYAFEGRLNGATIRVNIGTAADWSVDAAR
jgi:hypothetical protein